jgi:hypothetical protein
MSNTLEIKHLLAQFIIFILPHESFLFLSHYISIYIYFFVLFLSDVLLLHMEE